MTRLAHIVPCIALVCAVGVASAPLAADQATPPASCVRTQSIDDWRALEDGSIVVRTSPSKSFKVTFTAPCRHLKWSVLARVDTRPTGALACLTRGDVILFGRGPRRSNDTFEQEERCVVKSIEPYEEPQPTPPPPAN